MKTLIRNWYTRNISLFIVAIAISNGESPAQKVDVYSRPVQVERSHDYDALHYKVELSFDMENKTLYGINVMTVRALRNNFNSCLMDAGSNLTIKKVLNYRNESLDFSHRGDSLEIFSFQPVNYNDTISFIIEYSGVDTHMESKIFHEKSRDNPAMINGPNFPNRVRTWMPCYDYPNDKATNEMIIHAPAGMKAVSNGLLVEMKDNSKDGTSVWHWKMDNPHSTYLYVLAVAPYVVFKDSLGSLPVNYWVFKQDSASAIPAFSRTPQIIKFLNELYAFNYPWQKCDQVMVPPMGGAAESTTATLYTNSLIVNLDEKGLKDYSFDWIIAHETAHHWWGDLITLRTWSETWLNESFGTYSDHIWTARTEGDEAGAIDLEKKKNDYLNEAHKDYIRPIVFNRYDEGSPGQNFDKHTYPKGALMLHLLRSILGDDLFFRTISYFLHKNAFQSVDTHDFMKAVKEVTGQNMDWFFEQFFYRPGHPVFNVTEKWDDAMKTISLEITQIQDTLHGVPYAFRLPVTIGIYTKSEKIVKKIWIDKRSGVYKFHVAEKPQMVKFDDDNILLDEVNFTLTTDELLFKLTHDDLIGRAEAAAGLSAAGNDKYVNEALMKASLEDQSWYVRKAALESLNAKSDENIMQLSKTLSADPNSQVRAAAIKILGTSGDKRFVSYFKARFNKDDSYRVQAACINAIGKCGSKREIDFLEEAGKMRSSGYVIENASRKAIDEIRLKK
jgi:aminopeptidase N